MFFGSKKVRTSRTLCVKKLEVPMSKNEKTIDYTKFEKSPLLSPFLTEMREVKDSYQYDKVLGRGTHTNVKLARHRLTGNEFALK